MTLLLLAAISVPEQQPALAQALEKIDRDAVEAQRSDLDAHDRIQLALELRTEGARVPALTVSRPPPVQKLARNVEQRSGRLFAALTKNDRDAIGREAGLLQQQVGGLRAAVAP